jgi:hypothetical protein
LAVGKLCALVGWPQHMLLGLGERIAAFAIERGALLEARAENRGVGGNFVVLGVRGIGSQRDRLHFIR